jgi:type II secretory pathway component PulJ
VKAQSYHRPDGFTLVEILIAIGILMMVVAAIYATWTAILRGRNVGLQASAAAQRARIVVRVLEDSLSSAEAFGPNQRYYGFEAENGNEAYLSFVARLAKSFPRSGKFGDLDVRRLTFSVEAGSDSGRELVLRQNPLVMEMDVDEKEHPLVLAKNVQDFEVEFWDARLADWTDEWKQTNTLPKLVKLTLKLGDNPYSTQTREELTQIVSIPAVTVLPLWQAPPQVNNPSQNATNLQNNPLQNPNNPLQNPNNPLQNPNNQFQNPNNPFPNPGNTGIRRQ